MAKPVYTVTELTRSIKRSLEGQWPSVAVQGEVSGLSKPYSGHIYFTLKDAGATLSSAFFKAAVARCPFDLEEGLEIVAKGRISLYEPRGSYQLIVESVEPVGEGALQLAFEQLKARLEKEGLFDEKHKKKLPFLPQKIGIVTSATGAALQDMLNVLERRNRAVPILIAPTLVQGEQAPPNIIKALQTLDREPEVDLIIIGRGGGSLEDLWGFNDEALARAIFACKTPVVSAVGHETDFTIADFVSDFRAPTPSAAAELAVPELADLLAVFEAAEKKLARLIKDKLEQTTLTVDRLAKSLRSPALLIEGQQSRVEALELRAQSAVKQKFAKHQLELTKVEQTIVLASPRRWLLTQKTELLLLNQRLQNGIKLKLRTAQSELGQAAHLLDSLSPLAVLKRGYSAARDGDGQLIKSVSQVQPKEAINIEIQDGLIQAEVKSIKKKQLKPKHG